MLPQYGTVMKRGVLYYRTRIKDANGKLVAAGEEVALEVGAQPVAEDGDAAVVDEMDEV